MIIDTDQNKTIDFTSEIPRPGNLVRPSDLAGDRAGYKAIAIVGAHKGQYLYGNEHFTGYFQCRLEQLKQLGYITFVVSEARAAENSRKDFRKLNCISFINRYHSKIGRDGSKMNGLGILKKF